MKNPPKLSAVKLRQFRHQIQSKLPAVLALVLTAALLLVFLCIPSMKIYGSSMAPTLLDGDLVFLRTGGTWEPGQIVAFHHGDKLLVRRIIAGPGSLVDMDATGKVTVDGKELSESYITAETLGQCNISLPCQIPDGHYFLLGDNRAEAVDSRSTLMGCVAEEDLVGVLTFRFWPLDSLGPVQ